MTARQRDELLIRIDERQQQMLKVQTEMLAEAKKTNGRVTTLEEWHVSEASKQATQVKAVGIGWKIVVAVASLVSFTITILISIFL